MTVLFLFDRIFEAGKEKGFGQSILHEDQLVFHTPPYSLQDVTLQDVGPSVVGKEVAQEVSQSSKVALEKSKSVMDRPRDPSCIDEIGGKLSIAMASPLIGSGTRKPLGRRFSYTSNRYELYILALSCYHFPTERYY